MAKERHINYKTGQYYTVDYDTPAMGCLSVIINIILLIFVIYFLFWLAFEDDEDYIKNQNEKKEQELRESESECRAKGMYPVRSDCEDLSSATCHVFCWIEPQKSIND